MDRLIVDLRYGIRLLRRSPGWSMVGIVSLALGIAGNAVVFSLVDAVLLKPFPYRDADRLVLLWGAKDEKTTRGISGADLNDWREQSRAFVDLDAFLSNMAFSLGATEADRVKAACIGHRVLPILGVQPAAGRNFTEADVRFGAAPVVLISDGIWHSRFGGSPGAVGSKIRLDDTPYEIVGVMPPGFFFPDTDARLWVPVPCGMAGFEKRGAVMLHAVGRLRDDISTAQAQADLDVVNARLARVHPDTNANVTAGVFPLLHIVVGRYEQALWVLAAAIALVLLIACTNVVHLQLARGVERAPELAIRAAAGAGRARLIRQLLTESALLTAIAAVLALALAWLGVRLIHAFRLTDIPRMEMAQIDAQVLVVTAALAAVSALVSGVWPAWKASAVDVSETLKLGAAGTSSAPQGRARDLLAIAEITIAVSLLVASGLVVKSFVRLARAEWGFNPDNVLLFVVKVPRPLVGDRAGVDALIDDMRTRLKGIAGIEHVAVGGDAPIRWSSWAPRPLAIEGRVARDLTAGLWVVGLEYFGAAGIPIREGREFSEGDDAAAPRRVVVSEALARRLWPQESALGKSLQILEGKMAGGAPAPGVAERMRQIGRTFRGWPDDLTLFDPLGGGSWEIIGVAEDVRMFGLNVNPNPAIYVNRRQLPATRRWPVASLKVMLKTSRPREEVIGAAKPHILAANPELTFSEIVPMADLVAQSIGGRGSNKLLVIVATAFGSLALLFATVGIYGVVAQNVNQRLREIGIRIALGAGRREVRGIVLRHACRLLINGFALGLTVAWAGTRGMASLLFNTPPTDPATYAAAVLTLTFAAVLACALPLRRALRLDPVVLFKA
jgi:putative ABC transport system permease protein